MSDDLTHVSGTKVSRRWLLRSAATMTISVVTAGTITDAVAEAMTAEDASAGPDHDAATGEIFDRERHHHWDTV